MRKFMMAAGAAWLALAAAVAEAAEFKASFGTTFRAQYEGADELEIMPAIAVKVSQEERYLLIEGFTGRINVINSLAFNFGPLFSWREAREDLDDPAVGLMRDVDGAFEAGAFASLSLPTGPLPGDWMTFEIEALQDTSSVHEGATTTIGATLGKKVADGQYAMLTVAATHASEGFADTYFGVDAADSLASGLPVYDPGAGIKNVDLVGTLYYGLGGNWTFGTEATWSVLQGEFADSPVVMEGSRNQYRLIFTVTRSF